MDTIAIINEVSKKYTNITADYEEDTYKRIRERNLEVWKDQKKIFITKEYNSVTQLSDWYMDQIIISFIYDAADPSYKNNIYFLVLGNLNDAETIEVEFLINEIEKDYKVCRKYVLLDKEDLIRVPFFNKNLGENSFKNFNFDSEFKTYFVKETNDIYGKKPKFDVNELIETYFEYYEVGEENQKIESIQKILEGLVK